MSDATMSGKPDTKGLCYEILDVFAEAPWSGNPLAVVHGATALDGATMQAIAREMNLSETTFVCGSSARDGAWDVRIFTPRNELPFAGHPTLGTAFALRARHEPGARALSLRLGAGVVPVRFEDDGRAWLTAPPISLGAPIVSELVALALGLEPGDLDARLPVQVASLLPQLFVPLASLDALERARVVAEPYTELMRRFGANGIYPFARGGRMHGDDFTVRLFAPEDGIAEDPATGSAAAQLGRYLVEHQVLGSTTVDVVLAQGAQIARPSRLYVRADRTRVEVGGRVIPVSRGEFVQ